MTQQSDIKVTVRSGGSESQISIGDLIKKTVQEALAAGGLKSGGGSTLLNGAPARPTDTVQAGDMVTQVPRSGTQG